MKRIGLAVVFVSLAACASSETSQARGDRVVDVSMGFIDGVVEACVDSMEADLSIEAKYGDSGAYRRANNAIAARAAGLGPDTVVWNPVRSGSAVTIMEEKESCTVGVMGLPLPTIFASVDVVLTKARQFEVEPREAPNVAGTLVQSFSKKVGDRSLRVTLVGLNVGGPTNLMATVSWSDAS